MAIDSTKLNFHAFLPLTYGNGPGARACLWLQGCTINCPGCFNPETHASSNTTVAVSEVLGWLKVLDDIEGLTISGGEPLQQMDGVISLCSEIRLNTTLSTIVFTGYRYDEAVNLPRFGLLTKHIDVLIAGPFDAKAERSTGFGNAGYKTSHFFSNRFTQSDLDATPVSEVIIGSNGELTMTGIDPLRLRHL